MPQATTQDPSSYTKHPIFKLRKLLLINAVVGAVLSFIAIIVSFASWRSNGVPDFVLILAMVCFGVSAGLSWADLLIWSSRKKKEELEDAIRRANEPVRLCEQCRRVAEEWTVERDRGVVVFVNRVAGQSEEEKHTWPVRWLMITEFIFTGLLVWMLLLEFEAVPRYDYSEWCETMWRTYATVPMLIAVVLHAKCCWAQYMHRQKQKWSEDVDLEHGRAASDPLLTCASAESRPAGERETQREMIPQLSNEDVEYGVKIIERMRNGAINVADAVSQLNKEVKDAVAKGTTKLKTRTAPESQNLLGGELDNGGRDSSRAGDYGSTMSTDNLRTQSTPSESHSSWSLPTAAEGSFSRADADSHTISGPVNQNEYHDEDGDDSTIVVKRKEKKGKKANRGIVDQEM